MKNDTPTLEEINNRLEKLEMIADPFHSNWSDLIRWQREVIKVPCVPTVTDNSLWKELHITRVVQLLVDHFNFKLRGPSLSKED